MLIHSSVVLITFSNAAVKVLFKNFRPHWLIGDEIGAGLDPKSLVPLVYNIEFLEKSVGAGDEKQLLPVVLTHRKNARTRPWPRSLQMRLCNPSFAQRASLDTSMFMECFRCTTGLEQPASKRSYNNLVVNGLGTALAERPKSQKTIDLIKTEFSVETTALRLVFNLHLVSL